MSFREWGLMLALAFGGPVFAQTACPPTPVYSPCDMIFELNETEAAAHPNPYASVELQAEFRSPRHKTFLMPAFWDGGRRLVIRFTPTEPGDWDYHVTGNIARFNDKTGKLSATVSDSLGFIKPANVHHFSYTEEQRPHLWMGDTCWEFASLDATLFQRIVDTRAAQKFNHMRGLVIGKPEADPAYFQRVDERIRYVNRKGMVFDLVLGGPENQFTKLFSDWQQRERYIRYLAARYSAMNITWQGVQAFETYDNGRELLKEIGLLLKKLDPYQHPRSTGAAVTSAPLLPDGWMDYVVYGSTDEQLGAIEHQLYPVPFINAGLSYDLDTDSFRHRLWNAAINGQYVTAGNTTAQNLNAPAVQPATAWFDFLSSNRHWDDEPYFDVDGGRALALEDVEYIIYIEKPGPVELLVEKHTYDIAWFNPVNGQVTREKKGFKGERYSTQPPDTTHDWVLRVSREGHKESMLRSYKFEARPVLMQEVEVIPQKVPFEVEEPSQDPLVIEKPTAYSAKLKRQTHATRSMMYLWTGEVAADQQGYRVLGTGAKGTFRIPASIARNYPAVLNLRLTGMNAVGKVYSADRPYRLIK